MDSFSNRIHDPLLYLNTAKSDLDAFLLGSGADFVSMAEELQASVMEKMNTSLDIENLEGHGQMDGMNWLHNSSLGSANHLDNDESIDGSHLVSVNPQSILPIQIIHNDSRESLLSSETANSAAIRLHANCSSLTNSPEQDSTQQSQISRRDHFLSQERPTICILSVDSPKSQHNSPAKTQNIFVTSTMDSPHKPRAFLLSTAHGLTLTAVKSPVCSSASTTQFILSSPQKITSLAAEKSSQGRVKSEGHILSPSQASPVILGHLQTGVQQQMLQQAHLQSILSSASQQQSDSATVSSTTSSEERIYPKPAFSYSCLIALALKNSKNGSLPVSEIYNFMCENFPYFKTAPDGWKNSVRHNLSLNKCFAKVDNPKLSHGAKKGCLWALNPAKIAKMEDEINKWGKKDPIGLLSSMAYPENLEAIEKGQAGLPCNKRKSPDSVAGSDSEIEGTPSKPVFSPVQMLVDSSPIRPEKRHSKLLLKNEYLGAFVKSSQVSMSPKQEYASPPSYRNQLFAKLDQADLNVFDIPGVFSGSLNDFDLQGSTWDEDFENKIDVDFICDLPTSHQLPSSHSTVSRSPILAAHSSQTTGNYSPFAHHGYSVLNSSPLQNTCLSPSSVRTSLFATSTPTRRTLYA